MSNFFAALDSDDEGGHAPAPAIAKKKAPKKVVVEPSKVEKRPIKEDRHTKGGRTNAPTGRDGKRQFDRKSGTGRGKEVKKGGGGGHNWGSDKQDAKNAEGPVTEGEEAAHAPAEDPVAANGGKEEAPTAAPAPAPEPEVDNTVSYEDYLAQKARPDSVAFRPVAERELDTSEFTGKAAGAKKETEAFIAMGGGKKLKKKGTAKKGKETLALEFKVKAKVGAESDRDRGGRREGGGRYDGGGRGGRDGGRGGRDGDRGGRREGGRGRGGERAYRAGPGGGGGGRTGGKGASNGLDTMDASAFPSL